MKKHLIVFILLGFITINSFGQETIKWYSMKEALELRKENPKPIFVDVYTDWCGWCKRLDAVSFKNRDVITLLNKNFYPVKFNAEGNDSVTFEGRTYINRGYGLGQKSTHDFARVLLDNKMSYPKMALFDQDLQNKHVIGGYKEPINLASYLIFYRDKQYKFANPQEFEFYFNMTYKGDTAKVYNHKESINWLNPKDAFDKLKKDNSKCLLFYITLKGNNLGTVQDSTTFKNKIIIDYINENFYPTKIDITSKDSFNINGHTFKNQDPSGIHDFVLSLPRDGNTITLPNIVIFNSDKSLMDRSGRYLPPRLSELWLHYLVDKHKWKNKETPFPNFANYAKTFKYEVRY